MKQFLSNRRVITAMMLLLLGGVVAVWWKFQPVEVIKEASQPNQLEVKDDKFLPLTARKRLWDIEHFAFLVEAQVLPVWKQALVRGDSGDLAEYLSAEFSGRVPDGSPEKQQLGGTVTVQRVERLREQGRVVGSDEFLAALFEYRSQFDPAPSACSAKIGLVRFGPVSKRKLDGPWRGVWKIRLSGTRGESPVEVVIDLAVTLDSVDEQIGRRKQWIRGADIDRVVITESASLLMRDVTKTTGIDVEHMYDNWQPEQGRSFRTKTGGVYVCDYDTDGMLDVLVEDLAAGTILYRGLEGGRFEDVTERSGLPWPTRGTAPLWTLCCWADLDGDADEDLILQDRLFENLGDGTFRDVTNKTNLLLTPAAGYAVGDFNRDGRVDLYVCHSGKYLVGQEADARTPWIDGGLGIDNVLWQNQGDWQFKDVTVETNAGGGGTACFAAVWFDADNDRWPDLLTINEFGINTLLINKSGRFTARAIDPIFGGFSMGVTAGDFNNDGHTDLYVANMYSKAGFRIISNVDRSLYPPDLYRKVSEATTGNKLYLSRGDGTFDVPSPGDTVADVGWAYGPAFVDLNGDGWLDVYATAGFRSIERGKPDG